MNPDRLPGTLSVLIPALDEEAMIFRTIQETARALDGSEYEIIVVDDGSTDGTLPEAQRAAAEDPRVQVMHCEQRGGKGSALQVGFERCRGDWVVFLDADLELHPNQIWTLYRVMQETEADIVVGSKQHPESRLDYPWQRQAISAAYYWLAKGLFGLSIRDTQTGIKLFRRAALADAFPRVQTRGYAYDLELLVSAMRFGYRIAEAPVEVNYRRQGPGRIGLGSIPAIWWDTWRIFYRASFWKWLNPAPVTRLWMVAFVVGLVTASFGVASVLTFLPVPEWLSTVAYCITLKFIPRLWRNLLLIAGGLALLVMAMIQLNKSVMNAFARPDEGDLSGIPNAPSRSAADQQASENSQV